MNNHIEKDLKKYYKKIYQLFPIHTKHELDYLSFLKTRIAEYLSENPYCTMDNIFLEFGTPKEIISEYLDNTDSDILIKELKLSKLIKRIILVITILIFTGFLIMMYLRYQEYLSFSKSNIVTEEITICEN